jgi:ATP-dependent RNA helicase DDX5/DBP2
LQEIQWDLSRLPQFEKNFYIEHPAVRARPDEEADIWRRSKNITVIGRGVPKVCLSYFFDLQCF